jgi:hypothetical protein
MHYIRYNKSKRYLHFHRLHLHLHDGSIIRPHNLRWSRALRFSSCCTGIGVIEIRLGFSWRSRCLRLRLFLSLPWVKKVQYGASVIPLAFIDALVLLMFGVVSYHCCSWIERATAAAMVLLLFYVLRGNGIDGWWFMGGELAGGEIGVIRDDVIKPPETPK